MSSTPLTATSRKRVTPSSALQYFSVAGGLLMLVAVILSATPALAQSQEANTEMSVEELEAFLEKRKKELETVIANRESMLQKQAEIREKLKAQQAKTADFEKQFLEACEELNLADPDNAIDCEKELEDAQ